MNAVTDMAGNVATTAQTLDHARDVEAKIMTAIVPDRAEGDGGARPPRRLPDVPVQAKLEEGCAKASPDCVGTIEKQAQIAAITRVSAAQFPDVLPPRRPPRLGQSESSQPVITQKALLQHN